MEKKTSLINFRKCFEVCGYKGHTTRYCYNALKEIGWNYSFDTFYSMWLGYRKVNLNHAVYLSKLLGVGISELIEISK